MGACPCQSTRGQGLHSLCSKLARSAPWLRSSVQDNARDVCPWARGALMLRVQITAASHLPRNRSDNGVQGSESKHAPRDLYGLIPPLLVGWCRGYGESRRAAATNHSFVRAAQVDDGDMRDMQRARSESVSLRKRTPVRGAIAINRSVQMACTNPVPTLQTCRKRAANPQRVRPTPDHQWLYSTWGLGRDDQSSVLTDSDTRLFAAVCSNTSRSYANSASSLNQDQRDGCVEL
jgi:hypothetical protein